MARKQDSKTINGHEWEVTAWDGMHGLKMQARIGKLIGPAVAQGGGNMMNMDVASVIGAVVERIDDKETPQLIRDMLHGTFIDEKDASQDRVFNEHFSANFGELYQGLMFVAQVNFGSLFQMAGAIGGQGDPAE
jgi:hypothetical protein